jgi:hypothetical protein
MKKNLAGQRIGVQMTSATDGSDFTGGVTVSVTVDAGTQATGSVGSGACTHEGKGYHTYAPSQAETNGELVAFTFAGTGAITSTVQVYPLPTTGVLAPTVADRTLDVSAGGEAGLDWANVGSPTTALALTGTAISASQVVASVTGAAGSVTGAVGSVTGAVGSVTAGVTLAANSVTAAALATDAVAEIQSGLATAAALATVAGYLDTEIAAIQTAVVTSIPASIAALPAASATAVWASDTRTLTDLAGLTVGADVVSVNGDAPSAVALNSVTDGRLNVNLKAWNDAELDGGDFLNDVRQAVGLASADLDSQLGDLPTAAAITAAVGAATVDGTVTRLQAERLVLAALSGNAAADGATYYAPDGTTPRLVVAENGDGRTVTRTP